MINYGKVENAEGGTTNMRFILLRFWSGQTSSQVKSDLILKNQGSIKIPALGEDTDFIWSFEFSLLKETSTFVSEPISSRKRGLNILGTRF